MSWIQQYQSTSYSLAQVIRIDAISKETQLFIQNEKDEKDDLKIGTRALQALTTASRERMTFAIRPHLNRVRRFAGILEDSRAIFPFIL